MRIFGKIADFCPSVNCKLTHLSCHCDSVVVKILEHVDVDLDFWKICNTTYLRIDGAVSLDTRKGLIFLAFSWCNKEELHGRKSSSHQIEPRGLRTTWAFISFSIKKMTGDIQEMLLNMIVIFLPQKCKIHPKSGYQKVFEKQQIDVEVLVRLTFDLYSEVSGGTMHCP